MCEQLHFVYIFGLHLNFFCERILSVMINSCIQNVISFSFNNDLGACTYWYVHSCNVYRSLHRYHSSLVIVLEYLCVDSLQTTISRTCTLSRGFSVSIEILLNFDVIRFCLMYNSEISPTLSALVHIYQLYVSSEPLWTNLSVI